MRTSNGKQGPQPRMVTVKTQHIREERWGEYTRMMVLQQVNGIKTDRSGTYEIQDHIETEVQQP